MSDVDLFKKRRWVFHVFFENIGAKNSSVIIIYKVTYRNILCFFLLFKQRFSPSHQKMLSFSYPGYQRFLSCLWLESSVSAKGRSYERRSHAKKTLFARGTMNDWHARNRKPRKKSLWQTGNHSGFSEIAGPSFPWFFFLWVSLWMNFSGGHFPLLDFFLVSSPPPRPPSLFQ